MSEKRLNLISYSVVILFFIYTIFFIINSAILVKKENDMFNNMLSAVETINKKAELENLIYKKDEVVDDNVCTEPLYNDGLSALIDAYQNTVYANSLIATVVGDLTLNLPAGLSSKVSTYNFVAKYNDDKIFEEGAKYVISASGAIQSLMKAQAEGASKTIYENGNYQYMQTKSVSLKSGIVEGKEVAKGDFSGCNYINEEILLAINNLYLIDQSTVEEITYFKVKKKNGVPYQYLVQANLKTVEAMVDYSGYIAYNMPEPPDKVTFVKSQLTIIINSDGIIETMTTRDEFKFKTMGFDVVASLVQTYAISCVGEEIVKDYTK